jgi:CubicO group peptidase (beta-lactamase class C family)
MILRFLLCFIAFIPAANADAQIENKSLALDSILTHWNNPKVPGIAVAVVQNDNLLYQRTYGMAQLGKGIPIDSVTRFWIASVTKQFTAAGIYLLESENKISLQNSVRKYITELPPVFEGITIDHLIHHTSGIRDGFVLTALAKKQEEEYTNENVLKYLKQQMDLSFKPGTAFEYNNSGYVLLALVIERVSKQPYPEFMKTNIFTPLGMNHTYVAGKYQPNENAAEGYRSQDYSNNPGSFVEGHFKGNSYGSTGIMTTISDLAKWVVAIQVPGKNKNFKKVATRMLRTGKLSNGYEIAYAGGLEKFNYGGNIVFEHFGADDGFKANILYFPGTKLSIIGLANNTTNYQLSEKLYTIADVFLQKAPALKTSIATTDTLLWEQSYFGATEFPAYRQVKMYNGFAKISDVPNGHETYYYPSKTNSFHTNDPISISSLVITKGSINIRDSYYRQNGKLIAIDSLEKAGNIEALAGKYYSAELETSYEIIFRQGQLLLEFVPGVEFNLLHLANHDFIFDYAGPNHVHFTNDGFEFSRDGVHKLWYKKM